MRFLLASAFLYFSVIFSSQAQLGLVEGNLAKEIILFEANSYRVVTEFNVHAMQKDKASEQRLFDVLAKGDELGALFQDQSSKLLPSWNKYRSFTWEKHNQADGDIDTYVFNDMRILHKDLLTIIEDIKKKVNSDLLPAKMLNKVNGVLLIEQLASEYLEMSAATFGTFGFAGSDQAIQIEVRSQEFEHVLTELKKAYVDDQVKLKAVKKLALRWKFIKSTLLAYNERSAPFAVAKTVGYMRKQLAEI
jgi:hypothetical protein